MGVIRFEEGAHWYSKEGKPQHDADLRVARKQLLYPSVTTIDKAQFKNEFLEKWKMNELALAACENPRMPHESDEDYANRIYDISLTKSRIASEFGKSIHDAVEHYPQLPIDSNLLHWVNKFEEWWKENDVQPISREAVLLDHDIGVAGRTDLICNYRGQRAVTDYKTQNVKVDPKGRKKPAFYESWPRQLAFYAVADAKQNGTFPIIPTCVSLVIDSNPEGEIYEKVWSGEEILSAYEDFVLAAYSWQKRKKYWPAAHGKWSVAVGIPLPQAA